MAKYQQYKEYKDSGVEWLEKVPSHWEPVPIKYLASEKGTLFLDGDWIESKDISDSGIRYITTGNVGEGQYKEQGTGFISDQVFQKLNCSEVFEQDILISRLNLPIGRACLVPNLNNRIVTSVDNVILRPDTIYCKRFLVHLFSSSEYFHNTANLARGATMQRISRGLLGNIRISLPEKEEQVQIANFLDHETAQIDTLIDKQQTLIQLLKEKRQAVISHAVTKGLNPDAPMKDSGVEWLGDVPEHWEVGRVGYYGQVLNGSTPSKANLSYWHPKEVAWLSSGEVNQYYIESPTDYISYKALKECSVTLLPVGTLVMGMIGQGKTRGTSAVTKIEATINQNLAAVIPNENLYSNYAHLFFQAAYKELREDARGGNQAALNCEIIRDFKITIPPINEQRTIFIEVNKISDKFDILIVKAEQAIELMQERRTALISAAVTGKIDVRGWRASE